MTADRRYHSWLIVFGLVVVCAAMSSSHWMGSFWGMCCQPIKMYLGSELISRLASLTRGTIMTLVLFGFSVFWFRLWKTFCFISTLKVVASAPPKRLKQLLAELGLSRHVVVLATEIPLAFCFGLWRPRICLSTGLIETLTCKELQAVLHHEDHHRRRYDPLRSLLAESLARTLFFLPVAAELRDLFLTTHELAADRYAARLAGRPSLAGALHKMLTHPLASRLSLTGMPGMSGLSATAARMAELLGDPPVTLRPSARSLMTSSVILMLICTLATLA